MSWCVLVSHTGAADLENSLSLSNSGVPAARTKRVGHALSSRAFRSQALLSTHTPHHPRGFVSAERSVGVLCLQVVKVVKKGQGRRPTRVADISEEGDGGLDDWSTSTAGSRRPSRGADGSVNTGESLEGRKTFWSIHIIPKHLF